MKEVIINDAALQKAAFEGMDAFIKVFTDATHEAIGGDLTAENMPELNADQITLLAWEALHDEVMDGGFIQLIHNGYGGFIFLNPFNKAVREWGLADLATLISKCHKLYNKYHRDIERDCTDEEFMALYERMPEFDDYDDAFVEHEEEWTEMIARYIDEHIDSFCKIDE